MTHETIGMQTDIPDAKGTVTTAGIVGDIRGAPEGILTATTTEIGMMTEVGGGTAEMTDDAKVLTTSVEIVENLTKKSIEVAIASP